MKLLARLAAISVLSLSLTGCSGGGVDLSKVLGRASNALTSFQKYLKSQGVEKPTDSHMTQLTKLMQKEMNKNPAVHSSPVGVKLLKDSSFEGFSDSNGNNVKDMGDSKLFKVEIDFDNNRLIGSNAQGGGFTGMGLAAGMMAGMLMGRLMGGQRAAGVRSGAFNNRKVAPSRSSRSGGSNARSGARSGGRFSGK